MSFWVRSTGPGATEGGDLVRQRESESKKGGLGMQERQVGRSGLFVTELTLGTMTFGNQASEAEAFAILDRAYEAGIRTLDTADVYPLGGGPERRGTTERIVGHWLRERGVRAHMTVATKVFGAMGESKNARGLGRRHMEEALSGSLERLGIDAVDLYQAHGYDMETPLEETLGTFHTLTTKGLVRYYGVSNWRAYQVAMALGICDRQGLIRPVSVQPRYNALYRAIEDELVPLSLTQGLGILPYNPLAGGMLTGRYGTESRVEEGTRFALGHGAGDRYRDRYWQPATLRVAERLRRAAQRAGLDLAAAALRWTMDQPGITSPIVGASRAEQLEATLVAPELAIPAALRGELSRAWERLPRRSEDR